MAVPPLADKPIGRLIALAIGALTVAVANVLFPLVTDVDLRLSDLSEEWGGFLVQTLFVSFPFALLAIVGVQGRWGWGVALALTALIWGTYVADAYSSRGSGTGVNIGLGLIMLVSPAIIAAAAFASAKIMKEL